MSQQFAGNYPIESRSGEIERLHVQGAAMAPDADRMLERIGVREGWRCLDIGCGPRGITDLMARRVGSSGKVLGVDMEEAFLAHARQSAPANVEFRRADAFGSDLEPGQFDLVHLRFVASTAGEPMRLLKEAMRLAKPGGVVALQEPDGATLNCYPPHPSWDRLKRALLGAFAGVGADLELAHRVFALAREVGLHDVQYRPFLIGVRSGDPMADYLPSTVQSLRGTVVQLGLIPEQEFDAALAECRRHLAQPATIFTLYTVAQVWGRKPG